MWKRTLITSSASTASAPYSSAVVQETGMLGSWAELNRLMANSASSAISTISAMMLKKAPGPLSTLLLKLSPPKVWLPTVMLAMPTWYQGKANIPMSSTTPAPAVILSDRENCWSEFMASLSVLRVLGWVRWPDRHAPALQGRFNRVTPPASVLATPHPPEDFAGPRRTFLTTVSRAGAQ